jgi:type II restriction/modification system DNA methylase subunit YeeA
MTTDTSSATHISNFYRASAADFKKIPGSPIAYWVSESFRGTYNNSILLGNTMNVCAGMQTGDNDRFLRLWFEVSSNKQGLNFKDKTTANSSNNKWFPYNKGGEWRKWFGNRDYLVNWEDDGKEISDFKPRSVLRNPSYYFKEGITWSDITTRAFGSRFTPHGSLFDVKGSSGFTENIPLYPILALMNSKLINAYMLALNPTVTFQVGDISRIPFKNDILDNNNISETTIKLISIAKSDWDSYETSWDFTTFPFLKLGYLQPTLRETYSKLRTHWKAMTLAMQQLEEENNRILIEAYGLQDELTPDVPLSEITLTCNPYYRYNGDRSEEELEALLLTDTIKEFISYAVGCMFGRYSLDHPGLVLANQGEKIRDYLEQVPEPSFMPDADNIIPILEDEYFEDDIVGRFKEFLKVTFGEDTLSENLDFIAEALGSNGKKSSEAVLRDYFLRSFYKDHVKMYKKRPIYWLFSSGKGRAFNTLIYMHRYNKETLALMRTDYLLELEGKLDAKREMIKSDIGKDAQEKARLGKMIDEIMKYDELLKNKADEYIEIDLDDGVKVNYERFEGLVEKI